jgi:DNA-binding NtrC family response regulator
VTDAGSPLGRVLVIDDDPMLRRIVGRMLSTVGYDALTACDATSAYAILAETRIDAVLLDLRMPDVPGDALFYAIVRRWPRLTGRIALMSGDVWEIEAEGPAELRACPMLAKPFGLGELAVLLARLTAGEGEDVRRQGSGG